VSDAGPDYSVERRRLEFQKLEHEATIDKGKSRLAEIERQKMINIKRAELQNDELDGESRIIEANELSLRSAMADIDKKLSVMAKGPKETESTT
jgi:hypothetical protein